MKYNSFPRKSQGFTLLELLVVVILMGILAAVVIPMFVDHKDAVEQATAFTSMKNIASAMSNYQAANNGEYPPDRNPGQCPVGFAPYLQMDWANDRPLDGQWDWEKGVFGITAGISIYMPDRTTTYMREMDKRFDNGNLNNGQFIGLSQRYTYIIQH